VKSQMKSQLFEQDKMEKEGWFAIGRGSGESFQMLSPVTDLS